MSKQVKANRDGVINTESYNVNHIKTDNSVLCKRYE